MTFICLMMNLILIVMMRDNPDYDSYDILQGFHPTEFKYVEPLLILMEGNKKNTHMG